ncbi:DUF2232 domain-containing protein [Gemella cuniculi]|uniref:DUF2232 domain-containing protein n=1 Tax=Gemella cuniculi TaxID=150240 RepID=UPI0003FE4B27|nr:DUF2232 domain-containing protein [Gemella cuniculi]
MDDNISRKIKEELERLLTNKFFFREPSNNKVVAYAVSFILSVVLGALCHVEIIAAFLSVFPLTYVLGAKGEKVYIPLVIIGALILLFLSTPHMLFWFVMHMLLSYIMYQIIVTRNSKIVMVMSVSTFLFLGLGIYLVLLIKYGVISINKDRILELINSNIDAILATNQGIDKNLLLSNFENLQKTFPVTIFIFILIYSLGLVQYTLSMLSKEYIIIPTFPKFSRVMLSTRAGYIYIGFTLIELLLRIQLGENSYNFWYILVQNATSILALVFILNGLFTAFFFLEEKSSSKGSKILLVILMFLVSSLFELIGFVDSLFKLRESYIIMRKGR